MTGRYRATPRYRIDRFVMGGFSAEKQTESYDGIKSAAFRKLACRGWNLPGPWNAENLDVSPIRTATEECIQGAL